MKFINMTNTFTIFGSFCVFDEDTMSIINKVYGDLDLSIQQEPNNPTNKAGKVMRITDTKKHIQLTFRPNRIDVGMPGISRTNKNIILNDIMTFFDTFHQMFEGSLASRIAYVSNDFIFDENGDNMKLLANEVNFIPKGISTTELNLRFNTPMMIDDEGYNIVTTINNVMIGNNLTNMPQKKAIMIIHDINTIQGNDLERFELNNLRPYFEKMYDQITFQLSNFDAI